MRKDSVATVKPTVWSPNERVECFMCVLVTKTIQQDPRLAVRPVIAIFVRDEKHVGSSTDPHATEANLQPTNKIESFGKGFSRVKLAVARSVFEDNDCISALPFRSAHGIRVGFGNPQASTMIDRKSYWLMHLRFASRQRYVKSIRDRHLFGSRCWRKPIRKILRLGPNRAGHLGC